MPPRYEHLALTSGPENETRHGRCDHKVQGPPCCWRRCSSTWPRLRPVAPVADFTGVCVILSIAARENRVVHSPDVSNAVVRAPLAEFVYVRLPKILADRFGSKIMNLNKALYGLKHVPLECRLHLEKMLDTVKIIKAPTPCLFIQELHYRGLRRRPEDSRPER
jgi:Reverse transcriptase (RNA-dependent DNA polymerase)